MTVCDEDKSFMGLTGISLEPEAYSEAVILNNFGFR
jgi:hypothetical protein